MKLIFEDGHSRTIKTKEEIKFSSFSSYHLIIITGRAKSENQLGDHVTDDEDLIVKLNNKSFPKLGSDGLIDSPTAFSGGKLHNLSKTVYFLTFLEGEDHEIVLETDKTPGTATFESLRVYALNPVEKLILEPKIQAEDGDRRPWISFALDNLALKSIALTLTYSHRKRDSDDVKIKIDGKTQGNLLQIIKYFLWRFVGSLLPWATPTKTETQIFEINLPEGLHYVELEADRTPTLNKLIIDFGKILTTPEGERIPTVDNPKWTGSFYNDTEIILLSRAIYGEAGGESEKAKTAVGWTIRNRVEDSKNRWGTTYHEVILAKYQYEPFNDPSGKSFKKITQPQLNNPLEKQAWLDSYKTAELVFFGKEADPTDGANHFYVPSNQPKPDWADENKFTIQIGATRFYKL
ncbi:cell wall hydrolase [Candidatus Collierbacteria bacterium]|nr:cell wall hydrolase [Candidatus Collierbacteria bacterium]